MYLEQARACLASAGFVESAEIIPCTPEEVRTLEEQVGRTLPEAYREFLFWMGHSAGSLLRGSDVFYQDLFYDGRYDLCNAAEELLKENAIAAPLPEDAYVFFMHQGYQFLFFRLSEGDNPPVYFYGEGEGPDTFKLLYPKFSDFLVTEIEGHERIIENCARIEKELQERRKGLQA